LTASTGNIVTTLGNITADAGNISATLGSLSAGTTVTAGTGITATTGNIAATTGSMSAGTTVTAGTGISATTGDITAATGNLVATLGSVIASTNITAPTLRTGDPAAVAAIMSLNASTITLNGTGADVGLTITPKGVSGVILSTGNLLVSTGNITSTLGNIVATNGGVGAGTTVSAGTTVTAGTNLSSTAGNLTLPTTATAAGQITINGRLFMHNYGYNQSNTFLGDSAGNLAIVNTNNDRGINNTGIGADSLNDLVGTNAGEARANTAIGRSSGAALTSGSYNVIVGSSAADGMTQGTYNTLIGTNVASAYNSNESYNIVLGYGVAGTAGEGHILRIGNGTGTGVGQIDATYISGIYDKVIGGTQHAVYIDNVGKLGKAASSLVYKKNIVDMTGSEAIYNLRPVNFVFKDDPAENKQYGLIAEEVAPIFPELVGYDSVGAPNSVFYERLPAILLNEIIKLRARIEALEQRS
jgi:hypothetical protein